jgi:ADP-ribose pyrophosphatase YjhB (NUDIX family)
MDGLAAPCRAVNWESASMPRSYPDRPYVGVGIVVFRDQSVLLVRRVKPPIRHLWSIPGGAQEIGETVHQAALRELMEETAIEADLIGLIDVVDAITRDDDSRVRFHYTLVDFAAEWRSGEAVAGDDAGAVRWAKLTELDAIGLWSETIRIIRGGQSMREKSP